MEVTKKEAAAITAAVMAYLNQPSQAQQASPEPSDVQKTLAELVERITRLEQQVSELSITLKNMDGRRKRTRGKAH